MKYRSKSMLRSNLTAEVLSNIIRIYAEITDSVYAKEPQTQVDLARRLEYALNMLGFSNSVEWRFGSRLSSHTKLRIWREGWKDDQSVIQFALDLNLGADPNLSQDEIEVMRGWVEVFATAVDQYLQQNNLIA